jgi:hypothetical protein
MFCIGLPISGWEGVLWLVALMIMMMKRKIPGLETNVIVSIDILQTPQHSIVYGEN